MKAKLLNYLQIVAMLTLVSIATGVTPAKASPFVLKELNSVKAITDDKGLVTVTMIFQPECSWCKKQGKALAKAFQQCQSSINVNLVGTKGNSRQLRKELKHYHQDIPAFIADRKFLRKIGGYQASPTTLIFDSNGELVAKKRGFISDDKFANVLDILSHGACQI